jgi:hypothetical protein
MIRTGFDGNICAAAGSTSAASSETIILAIIRRA